MDKFYQTDGVHSYIVLNQIEMPQDSYEVEMVANNDFYELLSFDFRKIDDRQQMYYQIDGLLGIDDLLKNDELESKWVIGLLDNLVDIIFKLYDYLLSPHDLILDTDGIFYGQVRQRFQFIFLPGYDLDIHMQIKELIEKLMRIMNHTEREGVDFIYGLYELVQQERYDLKNIRIYIKSYTGRKSENIEAHIKDSDIKIISKDMDGQEGKSSTYEDAGLRDEMMDLLFSDKVEALDRDRGKYQSLLKVVFGVTILVGIVGMLIDLKQYQQIYHVKFLMIILIMVAVEIFIYMGTEKDGTDKIVQSSEEIKITETLDTTVLSEYGEATALLSAELPKYKLVPEKADSIAGEMASIYAGKYYPTAEYVIGNAAYVIGRDSASSDYCIANETVSRQHARIYRDREFVMIEDFNSTNGTFVNDVPVLSGHPVTISVGDCIRFGAVSCLMKKESQ